MKKAVKSASQQSTEVVCAFCGGHGVDPFGIMSPLSTCVVCSGERKHIISLPIAKCAFCHGSGVHPHSRLTCTCCSGLGVYTAPKEAVACPACLGSGDTTIRWPDSPLSCGYCSGKGQVSKAQAALYGKTYGG